MTGPRGPTAGPDLTAADPAAPASALHVGRLLFTPELLIRLTRGCFAVIGDAVPDDARWCSVAYDVERAAVSLVVEHPTFPASAPGDVIPILPAPIIRASDAPGAPAAARRAPPAGPTRYLLPSAAAIEAGLLAAEQHGSTVSAMNVHVPDVRAALLAAYATDFGDGQAESGAARRAPTDAMIDAALEVLVAYAPEPGDPLPRTRAVAERALRAALAASQEHP